MKNIKSFLVNEERANIETKICKKNKKIIIDIEKFKKIAHETGKYILQLNFDWGECELSGAKLDEYIEIQ